MAIAQTTNFYVNAFASPGTDISSGSQTSCGVWYGSSQLFWDGNTADTLADPGDFSCYVAVDLNDSGGNVMEDFFTPGPNDNLWYNGSPQGVQLSQYKAVHFDVLWDTANSTIGIDQFNSVETINPGLANSDPNASGVGSGLDVQVAGLGTTSPEPVTLGYLDIPDAASNGWVTVTIPINPSASGIDGGVGLMLKKWISTPGDIPANSAAYFWIGNMWFEGSAAPPPPPTLQLPAKPTAGLNVLASTPGLYDRQQVGLVASNGVSWVGHATTANPVTYSFTIDGFPQDPATRYACEAYLIMSPNPTAYDLALDYNEANAIIVSLQQGAGTTMMSFQDKINSPGSEAFSTIGTVTNNGTALGTWSVTFTSDTDVTMTAPNGSTSSFVFTNASSFAETVSPGMYLYLGMQGNNAASLNDAVCYSQFSLTGVAAAVTDNFAADTTLNTNTWYNFMATGPAGVFVSPTNAAFWLKWNTPASGFHLQESSGIQGPWSAFSSDLVINGAGAILQLVTTNDVPAGTPDAFFQLIKP
jgi:hypothetical protein